MLRMQKQEDSGRKEQLAKKIEQVTVGLDHPPPDGGHDQAGSYTETKHATVLLHMTDLVYQCPHGRLVYLSIFFVFF